MTNPCIKHMIDCFQEDNVNESVKLREVLQHIILLGLARNGFFDKAALYGLDKSSEELKFTLLKSNAGFDLNPYLEGIKKELAAFGYGIEVFQMVNNSQKKSHLSMYLSIGEEEKIQIKLELDLSPLSNLQVKNKLVLNPTSFYVLTLA